MHNNTAMGRLSKAIALLILCPGVVFPLAQAQAAACGAENQRPCTVFERVPSCNTGLVENFAKGRCLAPAAPKQAVLNCGKLNGTPCTVLERVPSCDKGLVEDFLKGRCVAESPLYGRASYVVKNSGEYVSVLKKILACMSSGPRGDAFKKIIENVAANKLHSSASTQPAENLVKQCVDDNTRSLLRRPPVADMRHASRRGLSFISAAHADSGGWDGRGNYNRMVTIGVGGGAMIIAGANFETGIAISLEDAIPARWYLTGDWSLGFGAGAGGGLVVGVGTDKLAPGDLTGTALAFSGKLLAGFGIAVSYDEKIQPAAYSGLAIAAGVGLGAEVATVHRSAMHIF